MFDTELEAPRPIADLDSPEVIQASDGSQKQLAALKATVESQQASIELCDRSWQLRRRIAGDGRPMRRKPGQLVLPGES